MTVPFTWLLLSVNFESCDVAQQVGGNQAYHGVDGQEEDGSVEASPRPTRDQHVPRELRRLHDHSVSMSDSGDARSNHPAGPRRTRAGSVPDHSSDDKQMPSRSADHAGRKRYSSACLLHGQF